ncbi:MAG: type II toxin-antitoxin system VapC family toxin [Eggerthellaceae bacterium]|jgi:PIN domain nuclease of toxin-antitoxin system|nr:type II toxin-antitoxin system VapC family toxin [Eggerthellaceae bacterium]MDR2721903.1 type II toxin-antitoxin system VapC family toxin [Coriobacteriaceae bacterium]
MRLLLDTHTLLWAAKGTLPKKALELIEDTSNELLFSPVNLWEIELKKTRLDLDPRIFYQKLLQSSYRELELTSRHVLALAKLPEHHQDPFDRILLSQAVCEQVFLLTADEIIWQYREDLDCIIYFEK